MKMNYFTTTILILISIAFSTLFERKILSHFNMRWGPMKSFFLGILIPISDFTKLLTKFFIKILFTDQMFLIPIWGMFIFLMMMILYPIMSSLNSILYGFLMFILLYSLMIYFFFLTGWSSKNKYSFIASFRVLVQSISYEVGFTFTFLMSCLIWKSMDFFFLNKLNLNFLSNLIFSSMWLIFLISESGRSPFDFIEGESELVSGFNIEYLGGLFSLIFLIEYGLLIFISIMLSYFLVGYLSIMMFILMFYSFCLFRCSFPRFRYDSMMYFFWKDMLIMLMFMYLYFSLFF